MKEREREKEKIKIILKKINDAFFSNLRIKLFHIQR